MKRQNLILIFTDKYDYSSLKVNEYLQYFGENVVRINPEDTIACDFNISIGNKRYKEVELNMNGITMKPSDIKSIWFRRGGIFFRRIRKTDFIKEADILQPQLNEYLSTEQQTLNEFIYRTLLASKIKILGNPFVFNTNKLSVLNKASFYGLDIPRTYISTQKAAISKLLNQNEKLVTKAIQDNFAPSVNDKDFGLLTQVIDEDLLSDLPDTFFPSLFQEKLEKKFDLRIFYLDGAFYSVAILSQENERTAIDFRNYDLQNPNRKNMFELPYKIKSRLTALLKNLRLNTASIDMVYTTDNRYVFLEINPVGQYDMVGKPMNFNLDKKIALWLARK
jgi:ATP-GRASP peptide maturase of grasp-with-spasm system